MQITCERKALIALASLTVAVAGCGGSSGGSDATSEPNAATAAKPAAAATVVVPQLVGLEQGHAHRIADQRGLTMQASGYVGKYGHGRYNISCVKVLSQSPVAGERRSEGATIWVIEKECKTPKTGPNPAAGTT